MMDGRLSLYLMAGWNKRNRMGNPQQNNGVDPTVVIEAQRIAAQLEEPLLWLVENVIKVLGQARADALLQQTLEIEAAGGILTATGERRRTPGGVYLKLLKEQITPEEQERIFIGGPKTKPKGAQEDGI